MRAACLIALTLAACTGTQPTITYAGTQRPIAGACDPASSATLTQRGAAIVLAPADGTILLTGSVRGAALTAAATLPGLDHRPYTLSFTGQADGQSLSGTLVTPRCRYALSLHRTPG